MSETGTLSRKLLGFNSIHTSDIMVSFQFSFFSEHDIIIIYYSLEF